MAEEAKKKKHLHQVRIEQAHDGSYVSHHTYKGKRDDHNTEPERTNAATHATPEEAGQAAAEQFGMNDPAAGAADPAAAAPDPGADAGGGAAPEVAAQ